MSAEFTPRPARIDVARYHAMIDAGIFRDDERIELIEGEMLEMPPIGSDHTATVNALTRLLYRSGIDPAIEISIGGAVTLGDFSEPQPDVMLLRPRADHYRHAKPLGSDVLLVIEVSDSSLRFDRTRKMALYARYGVLESWIMNLVDRQLELYREPGPNGYAVREVVTDRARRVSPIAVPGLLLDWAQALE